MKRCARQLLALGLASLMFADGALASPRVALATGQDDVEALAAQVERSHADYDAARAEADELQGRIDENEARIADIEAALPEQRHRAAAGMRTLYKFHQAGNGLIDLVLSANDFNSFISTIQYLGIIQARNADEVDRLVTMEEELAETRRELADQKRTVDERVSAAEVALAEAEHARDEARRRAAEQAAREAAEAQAAREAAARAAEQAAREATQATFTTSAGNEAPVSIGSDPGQAVITSDDVESWAERIDAYLGDSPLGGYGRVFAEAALASGVDPRWSPAISSIESSRGQYCFKDHNAWGWGRVNWPDWETAIREHVSGLARIYGYSITPSAAKMYCPPTWELWYSSVSAEMAKI